MVWKAELMVDGRDEEATFTESRRLDAGLVFQLASCQISIPRFATLISFRDTT